MAVTYTENYHLGKQENTADKFDMSVITQNMDTIDAELYKKVGKENGKGLSSNDYTDTEKAAVGTIGGKASAADLTAHTGNAEIHVTAAEKAQWNSGLSFSLPQTQIPNNSDADTYTTDGQYTTTGTDFSTLINFAENNHGFELIVMHTVSGNRGIQIMITSAGDIYVRAFNQANTNGSFYGMTWKKLTVEV